VNQNALLAGFCGGELYWEVGRFAPYVFWKKRELQKKYGDVILVCLTRKDRLDIYGQSAEVLVPIEIEGDETEYRQDCFRLKDFPEENYELIQNNFHSYYKASFNVVGHLYPNIEHRQFNNRRQFPRDQVLYDYFPRSENKFLLDNYLQTEKPIVTLAPRFRQKMSRNWDGWQDFYNYISSSNYLMDSFVFVICGKESSYVPDKKGRFYDINKVTLGENSSTIGLTIELLKRSILTVGSQSGIPNVSLLLGTEVLEWGDQRSEHVVSYNVKKTPITFIDDLNYKVPARQVLENMTRILRKKETKHGQK